MGTYSVVFCLIVYFIVHEGESKEICFQASGLGCFDLGKDVPWKQRTVPMSPRKIQPRFYFYDPEIKGVGSRQEFGFFNLEKDIEQLETSRERGQRELWVIIHGFTEIWPRGWMFPMKDALLEKGHQVLLVRWTKGSGVPTYFQSVANTRVVGAMVGRLLSILFTMRPEFEPQKTTIVGFSLGAHIAGFAGKKLRSFNDTIVKRIIGLDPAGPEYVNVKPAYRLSVGDAEFVQVLHTNAGSLDVLSAAVGFLGISQPIGDVDFYANGGSFQPHCSPTLVDVAKISPKFGYWIDTKPKYPIWKQRYFFNTPPGRNDPENPGNVCGCEMLLNFMTGSAVKGSLYISLVSQDSGKSPKIKIMNGEKQYANKKIMHRFVVSAEFCTPQFLSFHYEQKGGLVFGGPRRWKLTYAKLMRDDGKIWKTLGNVRIYAHSTISVKLFQSHYRRNVVPKL